MKISLAKILSVLAPGIATISGALATWLVVHVHLFATFHVGTSDIANAIAQGIVFGVTAIGTYLIQHKILTGIIQLAVIEREAQLRAAAVIRP